jgi:LysM repeat protein
MSTYTIKAGDTFSAIATELGTTVQTIEGLNPGVNPNDLQIGQVINIPGTSTYTIAKGDTFSSIASRLGTTVQTLENLNPGINPDDLQIGQVIQVPPGTGPVPSPIPMPVGYIPYSGPASSFPDQSQWADYQSLWAFNSTRIHDVGLYVPEDVASSIAVINYGISIVSAESGVDERVILCIIMQESGGYVLVPTTTSPPPDSVSNTGIMQAHNGASVATLEAAERPVDVVLQMIKDGTEGTHYLGPTGGDGLKQLFADYNNWYEAFRAYNSGSVDMTNLSNGLGATDSYVSDVANRLMGHVWPSQ